MMNDVKTRITDIQYQRAATLLSRLFDADSDIERQINDCICRNGIAQFFDRLEAFEFTGDVLTKLQAVRLVLLGLDGTGMRGGAMPNDQQGI